jgi:hypothetical protein
LFLRLISLLVLVAFTLPAAAAASSTWFISTPAGAALPKGEIAPAGEALPGMAQELEQLSRREDEPFPLDLSRYQFVGQSGPLSLQVGHQILPGDGLILGNHPRQGFSLRLEGGPREAAIAGFVLQAEAESIEGDALGLSNEHNRLGGVTGEISPWREGAVQLRFKAGFLGGTRPGPHNPQKGEAWSMAAEAEVGPKLLLRGEFAGSRYEHGPFWDEQEGRAAVLMARYGSVLRRQSSRPVDWHIGVENSHIDSGFHSLGNPFLISDRERVRFFGGVRRDRLRLSGHVNRDRNNLDDLRHRPTIASSDYSLALHYNHLSPLSWLGTPRHALIFDGFYRRPVNDRADFRYGGTDDERTRVHYRVDFSRRNWEWGAGYRFSTYEDHTASWRDADEQSIDLRVEARIAERLFLAPFTELGLMNSGGENYQTRRFGLRGNVVLIPDRLRGGWNAQLSFRELPAERWERNASLDAELASTLRAPGRGRSGLLLSLNGRLRSWDSDYFPETREYGLFLNLRSTLG